MAKPMHDGDNPWQVPLRVDEVPESGRHFRLEADANVRAAVARALKLRSVDALEADLEVTRRGAEGLRVRGSVKARVGQECVVTLEPLTNTVDEAVEVDFAPTVDMPPVRASDDEATEMHMITDGPEPLIGGAIDLGVVATEHLLLGIDPYPRKDGAMFDAPAAGADDAGPFAALAALKKKS